MGVFASRRPKGRKPRLEEVWAGGHTWGEGLSTALPASLRFALSPMISMRVAGVLSGPGLGPSRPGALLEVLPLNSSWRGLGPPPRLGSYREAFRAARCVSCSNDCG